jgi:hypothetical protein
MCFGVALADAQTPAADPFALDGHGNILQETHFGIANRKVTCGIPYRDVLGIKGIWAPPYVSSDFGLCVSIFDKTVTTKSYTWHPLYVERSGEVDGIAIESVAALIPGSRAGLLSFTLKNTDQKPRKVPLVLSAAGTLDRAGRWEFGVAQSTTAVKRKVVDGQLWLEQNDLAIAVQAEKGVQWDENKGSGSIVLFIPANGMATFSVAVAIGSHDESSDACRIIMASAEKTLAQVRDSYRGWVDEVFQRLPRFESNNKALERLYARSLVPLLTNRWDVPEFKLRPYYSTGSINGGCVCEYLWNYGDCWEMLPLYDAEAAKTHIRKFLAIDMTKHFAFEPLTGEAFGPWYMVNQEKIIGSIYYYVATSGDTAFLGETIAGRTVMDHVIANAMYGDDPAKPIAMIDYGASNSHLELRRGIPYNHVMPDLNGRRYANYIRAAELAERMGKPSAQLRQRAKELKTALKKTLWNKKTRWFDFVDDRGKRDARYTVQMFKLFGTGVLDAEEETGLLSHFRNRKEFVSDFGLHSLAKIDAAYDPADIDNGGPGICTGFVGQIVEKLYKAGRPADAEALLKRILWWGDRMPYWGDSITADRIDYRRDTPLQCTLDSVAIAQGILFGMFGVRPDLNGDIVINPRPPAYASQIKVTGFRLRDHVIDISVDGERYDVRAGEQRLQSAIGQAVRLHRNQLSNIVAK